MPNVPKVTKQQASGLPVDRPAWRLCTRWLFAALILVAFVTCGAYIRALPLELGFGNSGVSFLGGTQVVHVNPSRQWCFVPEYKRRMKTVVLSLPDDDLHPRLQQEVLSKLPEYTNVMLLVPDNRLEFTQQWLADQPYGSRTSLLRYDPRHRNGARLYLVLPDEESLLPVDTQNYSLGSQHGTQWAQDLFEPAVDKNGQSILLTSCTHKSYQALHDRNDRQLISDNAYLQCLDFGAIHVQRLNVAFKGGNVLMDEHLGESIAFCGYDSARTTRTVWEAFHGEMLSDDRIVDMLKNVLDVDKLILIGGPFPQPELMYHLDQSMLLMSGHIAAVP